MRLSPPRMCASLPTTAMLYSLLHLGGFDGDVNFYRSRTKGAGRILELGAGDGRVGKALAADAEYMGIESCAEFVASASGRLERGTVLEGDMLAPLPEGTEPFDAVVMTANTLFCTPQHAELLARCREALVPRGQLLFDVYNAIPWHEEALHGGEGAGTEMELSAAAAEAAVDGDEGDLLVRAIDATGREWSVFERDPEVDADNRKITCQYDFEAAAGLQMVQTNVHHYALPDELRSLLGAAGFEIEATFGGFEEEPFDVEESDHLVFVARLRS